MGRTVKWPGKRGGKTARPAPKTALGRSLAAKRQTLLRIRKWLRFLAALWAAYAAVRPVIRLLWAVFGYLRLRRGGQERPAAC